MTLRPASPAARGTAILRRSPARTAFAGLLALAIFAGLVVLMGQALPPGLGIDWRLTYGPAAQALLRGDNPFDPAISAQAPFFAAPWALLPLLPLTFLPVQTGRAVVMLGGLVAFAYAAWRLGAKPLAMGFFLLSPPVMHCLVNANIEWMVLLGFSMPPSVGLFFITTKPQTGFGVAIFWLVEAWRKGGWREVARVFAPVTVAYVVTFLLYGLWPLQMGQVLAYGDKFNASLWPWSIPVGLALLALAILKRQAEYAMGASTCLSPYALFHSWSAAILALVKRPALLLLVVVALWTVVVMRVVSG